MTDHFSRLPWFLKEYVHSSRWRDFRDVQVGTFDAFSGSDDHILVSAGTSSGKTEAAMFPVIASLYSNPPESVGAMYVGPLKALIDDQFLRLGPMLGESGIEVTGWHGDTSRTMKEHLMAEPSGILQITPESLQNILYDHPEEVRRLFCDLRFIIIDEVHAFMDSDRGLQLQCCLQRLELMAGCDPRRIGLSATISDTDDAAAWLTGDTGRKVAVITDDSAGRRRFRIVHETVPDTVDGDDTDRKRAITGHYRMLYNEIRGRDCIVFVNSRSEAETVGRSLKVIAGKYGQNNGIYVHHGSVSREFRKEAEDALRDGSRKATVVSTVTLELGIDIGGLDRIIQIEPPLTCSSMVQRIGRSGRRGGVQDMTIVCLEDLRNRWLAVEGVDMNLIKAVAMVELVTKEGFTERPRGRSLPYGLLYHQTMEYLRPGLGARFGALASDVLSMGPFRNIGKEDYKVLLRHMVSSGQLVRMEDGTLLIGPKGERVAFDRDFCSVFSVKKEIDVVFDGKTVGSVQELPEVGELIQLAGRIWEVVKIRPGDAVVDVEEADGSACNPWKSGTPGTDMKVMRMMRDILESDDDYPYLDDSARARLERCRADARARGMLRTAVSREGGVRLYPWLGTVQLDTLRRIVRGIDGVSGTYAFYPYYIDVRTQMSPGELLSEIERVMHDPDPLSLIQDNDRLRYDKYDAHVPEVLLKKSFAADRLDTDFDIGV